MMTRIIFMTTLILLCAAIATPGLAAPKLSDQQRELARDLLLDGLDGLLSDPESEGEAKPGSPEKVPEGPSWLPNEKELQQRMKESLEGKPTPDQLGEDIGESPLVLLRSTMDRAGRLIATGNDGGETKPTQETIVHQLDELISQMQKQCQNCQKSGGSPKQSQQSRRSKPSQGKPGEPQDQPSQQAKKSKPQGSPKSQNAAQQSSMRLGQAEAAQAEAARRANAIKQVWGKLPERLREQMLQSTTDEFLPEYRDEIQQYFERLAEEEN